MPLLSRFSKNTTAPPKVVAATSLAAAAMCAVACSLPGPAPRDGGAAPIFGVTIPADYRDWKLISVAHEAGELDDLRAVLGNDVAVAAFREGRSPLPDGAILARLAWRHLSSTENDRAFGREQSFVAGPATNVQFMVRDSQRYAATDGWGYGHFQGGEPANAAVHGTCAGCHAKTPGSVFTRYAP